MNKPNHYYKFLDDGELLIAKISKIIDKQDESMNIPFESLKSVSGLVQQCIEMAKKGNLPSKDKRNRVITRIIIDSWPLNTELGNNLTKWENLYMMLEN